MHQRYAGKTIARLQATGAILLLFGCSTGNQDRRSIEQDPQLNGAAMDSTARGGAPANSDSPPRGTSGSGAMGAEATIGTSCESAELLESPLRRLTRLEYNNTVRDLLGVDLAPADDFPPDEIAGGFNNNARVLTVSPLLLERYMEAAEALAAEALKNLPTLLPCDPVSLGEEACARRFVEHFGRRAYRRPLSPSEGERLMRAYSAGRKDASFSRGIELVIRTALQSPSFLYRLEFGQNPGSADQRVRLSQQELATRLSYFLWSSMPNEELLQAADAGELAGAEQVETHARRMLLDERARNAITEFYRQWMGLGALDSLVKDATRHPEFDPALKAAMRAETPAFVEHVLWSADRQLSTLLTAPYGFVTAPLARVYGVTAPSGVVPERVTLNSAERAGLLTQAAVLAVHALPNQSSPVARGKFVRERFLCQEPDPPPPDLNVTPPEVDPTRSTRERFAEHRENVVCAGCHELMDPIGFAFESYDAVGRFRTTDGGREVDSSGYIAQSKDVDGAFSNVRELAEKLARSQQVQDCVAGQWFRYAFGRHEGNADACSLEALRRSFSASGGDLIELLVALTQTESFLHRRALGPAEVSP